MLKTNYTLNFGQLLKIVPKFKIHLWHKLKPKKIHDLSKTTIDKQLSFSIPQVGKIVVIIDGNYPSIDCEESNRGCVVGWRFLN